MTAKHTHGPWHWIPDQGLLISRDGGTVLDVDAQGQANAWVNVSPANARLIAAAPLMLEALRDVIDDVNLVGRKMPPQRVTLEKIEAAILAATGEEYGIDD